MLEVRDTGCGIAADDLPHVFERFHRGRTRARTLAEGSGIGLSLVQELVKLHGGDDRRGERSGSRHDGHRASAPRREAPAR